LGAGDTLQLWDSLAGEPLALLEHDGRIHDAAFSPDGARLATAGDDNTVRLWDSANGQQLALLSHDATVYSVLFSPDGTRLATLPAIK
jgi:WD40 repeat protein